MNKLKTETETKARRLYWSKQHVSLDWDKVVFTGFKKIGLFKMWGAISRFDQCPLRILFGSFGNKQYQSLLDDYILQMWKGNQNLIFMQDKRCVSRFSDVTQTWRAEHPDIRFLDWPEFMNDINPITGLFSVVNDQLKHELYDPEGIYESWVNVKEDFDEFRHLYSELKDNIQNIVDNNGN